MYSQSIFVICVKSVMFVLVLSVFPWIGELFGLMGCICAYVNFRLLNNDFILYSTGLRLYRGWP